MNYLTLDTETAMNNEGKRISEGGLVYDIGGIVHDENGKILEHFSFVVREIFTNYKIMQTAYYFSKYEHYEKDLREGKRIMLTWAEIKKFVNALIEKYDVKIIFAHNAMFDINSITKTEKYVSYMRSSIFFPYDFPIWDTLKMWRMTFGKSEEYKNFCKAHGYVTKFGAPRMTAEIIHQYLTGNTTFTESHTGLEDAMVEKDIACMVMQAYPEIDGSVFTGTVKFKADFN